MADVPERVVASEVLMGRGDGGPERTVGDTVTVAVGIDTVTQGTVNLKAEEVEVRRVS